MGDPLLMLLIFLLYTLRHDNRCKLCLVPNLPEFRASLGGQKYHESPHKAIIPKKKKKKKQMQQQEG